MSDNRHLKAWVSRDTKERFAEFARGQGMSESALLKRVIQVLIGGNEVRKATLAPLEQVPAGGRLSVRLAVATRYAAATPFEGAYRTVLS